MAEKTLSEVLARGAAPSGEPGFLKTALSAWAGRDISLKDGGFWSSWFGASNWTGKHVSINSALQLSAAWACIRLISETLSTLPIQLFLHKPDGSKTEDRGHSLYTLLHTQPNAEMTAVVFWQAFFASMLLWGNTYVEKKRNSGVVTSLEFLVPDHVTYRWLFNGDREWFYHDPITRQVRTIAGADMWHTPAFTIDGCIGLSPIRMGANVLGGAMAADQAGAETFSKGLKSPGLVMMDAVLKDGQREKVREHVKAVSESGGVMVLEKGAGFQQLTMNPQDAELLLSRHFNVEEICRWFRVPPFMVGHGDKSTSWGTGIEQQMIGFVTFVLRPWCVRVEQSIRKNLLTPVERLTRSAEFTLEGLLRGDSASRAAFYSTMTQNGIFTRDYCRALENQPPMGGNAAVLTVQSNLLPIDKLGTTPSANAAQNALKDWLGLTDKEPSI